MWYFSWILGTGLALAFGVLNAIWYEVMDRADGTQESGSSRDVQGRRGV
jgi:cytochrome bd-I ubiquinol oxidase subunit X